MFTSPASVQPCKGLPRAVAETKEKVRTRLPQGASGLAASTRKNLWGEAGSENDRVVVVPLSGGIKPKPMSNHKDVGSSVVRSWIRYRRVGRLVHVRISELPMA